MCYMITGGKQPMGAKRISVENEIISMAIRFCWSP